MEIGTKIKKLREEARLSQPELADYLAISQTTLCKIESSLTRKIDFGLIHKLCDKFNVGFDHFINQDLYTKENKELNDWIKIADRISDLVVEKIEKYQISQSQLQNDQNNML